MFIAPINPRIKIDLQKLKWESVFDFTSLKPSETNELYDTRTMLLQQFYCFLIKAIFIINPICRREKRRHNAITTKSIYALQVNYMLCFHESIKIPNLCCVLYLMVWLCECCNVKYVWKRREIILSYLWTREHYLLNGFFTLKNSAWTSPQWLSLVVEFNLLFQSNFTYKYIYFPLYLFGFIV